MDIFPDDALLQCIPHGMNRHRIFVVTGIVRTHERLSKRSGKHTYLYIEFPHSHRSTVHKNLLKSKIRVVCEIQAQLFSSTKPTSKDVLEVYVGHSQCAVVEQWGEVISEHVGSSTEVPGSKSVHVKLLGNSH